MTGPQRLREWAPLPHETLIAEIQDLIAREPEEAAALFAWLVGEHQLDTIKVESERRHATEAIAEACRYRRLWEVAAHCLDHNRRRLAKPRGDDERRMLAQVVEGLHSPAGGSSSDWLDWLPDPSTSKPAPLTTDADSAPGLTLFDEGAA
jgi:hypothetical protein